jgi:hypothetical protein
VHYLECDPNAGRRDSTPVHLSPSSSSSHNCLPPFLFVCVSRSRRTSPLASQIRGLLRCCLASKRPRSSSRTPPAGRALSRDPLRRRRLLPVGVAASSRSSQIHPRARGRDQIHRPATSSGRRHPTSLGVPFADTCTRAALNELCHLPAGVNQR